MYTLVSDAKFNSIALICIALVGAIPLILSAYWSKQANNNSKITRDEVRTNGGMTDPNPNLNDYVKYNTEMLEGMVERQANTEQLLANHIGHSRIMDAALAEVYLYVMPEKKAITDEDSL